MPKNRKFFPNEIPPMRQCWREAETLGERAIRRKSILVGGLLTVLMTAAVVGGAFAIFSDQVQPREG